MKQYHINNTYEQNFLVSGYQLNNDEIKNIESVQYLVNSQINSLEFAIFNNK